MPIAPNFARRRLEKGELALGFGVHHLRTPAVGMIAAASGFDWLFIDMEHGAMSVDDATRMAMAALSQGITPMVRCCKDALFEGTRCLDNGAMGVVVPHIDNADEARDVVRAFRYPPLGERSWGGPPAQYAFQVADTAAAQKELNEQIMVTVMIETPEAVANADAIAAVPGVDCLMIGTSDLTASMGIAGQIGHPDVRAAYAKVAAACTAHGKIMGMGGVYDEKVAPDYIALGARFLLSGSDHAFLMAGGGARAKFLRGLQGLNAAAGAFSLTCGGQAMDLQDDVAPASGDARLIIQGYQPGLVGRVTEMHASFYSRHAGFGRFFESQVATGIAEFVGRLEKPCNGIWAAMSDDRIIGSIAIDGEDLGQGHAHLRWFILDENHRARGLGRQLLSQAMTFCDHHNFAATRLWTFKGLDTAKHLYESFGFRLLHEAEGQQWGSRVTEQEFIRP